MEEEKRISEEELKKDVAAAEARIRKTDDFTSPEELYGELIASVKKYHPSDDISLIEKAYRVAADAHKDQKRKSGEPYIIHPLCVAIILADLELDKESIQKKLALKGTLYQVVKTKVEKPQADELMTFVSENGLTGLIFLEQDTRRYYPYGNFASAVLGFANDDNHGAYGLESYYEKVLAGTPGRVVSMKNSRGVDMDLQYSQEYAAKDGDSLVLTIDETGQIVEQ